MILNEQEITLLRWKKNYLRTAPFSTGTNTSMILVYQRVHFSFVPFGTLMHLRVLVASMMPLKTSINCFITAITWGYSVKMLQLTDRNGATFLKHTVMLE